MAVEEENYGEYGGEGDTYENSQDPELVDAVNVGHGKNRYYTPQERLAMLEENPYARDDMEGDNENNERLGSLN